MNETATGNNSGTELTQSGSRAVRSEGCKCWVILDTDNMAFGPFQTAKEATAWAQRKWPDLPQREVDDHDSHGWAMQMVWEAR